MKGGAESPPRVSMSEILWSWVGAFLGILAISWIDSEMLSGTDLVMLIGSFGASAVLIYGAVKSPLAQPRNLVGGHILSAITGVAVCRIFPGQTWLAAPIAVATSIAIMHVTRTLHPPGGATALIAVTGSPKIQALGYKYVFFPAGAGALILLVIALILNNISAKRRYPEYWI